MRLILISLFSVIFLFVNIFTVIEPTSTYFTILNGAQAESKKPTQIKPKTKTTSKKETNKKVKPKATVKKPKPSTLHKRGKNSANGRTIEKAKKGQLDKATKKSIERYERKLTKQEKFKKVKPTPSINTPPPKNTVKNASRDNSSLEILKENKSNGIQKFQTRRAAFRKAKRDAGIPTTKTHDTHIKNLKADKLDTKRSATEYVFGDGKRIQHHPNGHTFLDGKKYDKRHFNNHGKGGTKDHYEY